MAIIFLLYRFLRSVLYRQFTRLVWEYMGCFKRLPLPCCAYNVIRKKFPSEDGQYQGFKEEDEEGQDTNENEKDDLEVGLFQILFCEF